MILLYSLLSIAFADPHVATLNEGQPAPFSGTLFNKEAVAAVLAESGAEKERCDARIELEVEKSRIELRKDLDYAEAEFESCEQSFEDLRESHIDLTKKYNRTSAAKPYIFSGGLLGGIALTLAVVYAVDGVQQ
jgi:hypothetical protein